MTRQLKRPLWTTGQGQYATVSQCPPGPTVILHANPDAAREALHTIDDTGCGHRCQGPTSHYLYDTRRRPT